MQCIRPSPQQHVTSLCAAGDHFVLISSVVSFSIQTACISNKGRCGCFTLLNVWRDELLRPLPLDMPDRFAGHLPCTRYLNSYQCSLSAVAPSNARTSIDNNPTGVSSDNGIESATSKQNLARFTGRCIPSCASGMESV